MVIIYNGINTLQGLVTKFPGCRQSINRKFDEKTFDSKVRTYFYEGTTTINKIDVGATVRTIKTETLKSETNPKYTKERNAVFKLGSVGEVIELRGIDYFVRFEHGNYKAWKSTNFDDAEFWRGNIKDVATYKHEELLIEISDSQKTILTEEADKLKRGLWQIR